MIHHFSSTLNNIKHHTKQHSPHITKKTMATKERADIVFLIDISGSMTPVLNAVKDNITKLVDTLANDTQRQWDIRLDFLAHTSGNGLMRYESVRFNSGIDILNSLYRHKPEPAQYFFTTDIAKFKSRLAELETDCDETTLMALDTALEYPWRPAQEGHRAIVLLTDEQIETGENVEEQVAQLAKLVEKIHRKRVKLYVIAPDSAAFHALAKADKSEYEIIGEADDGMRNVNFGELMKAIGEPENDSCPYRTYRADDTLTPLYRQDKWGVRSDSLVIEKGDR
jgi:hypothetical protein